MTSKEKIRRRALELIADTSCMAKPLAHVFQTASGHWRTHSLDKYLRATAALARGFAAECGNGDWG